MQCPKCLEICHAPATLLLHLALTHGIEGRIELSDWTDGGTSEILPPQKQFRSLPAQKVLSATINCKICLGKGSLPIQDSDERLGCWGCLGG